MHKRILTLTALILAAAAQAEQADNRIPIPPEVSIDTCNFLPFVGERFFDMGKDKMSVEIRPQGYILIKPQGLGKVSVLHEGFVHSVPVTENGETIAYYEIFPDGEGGMIMHKLDKDGRQTATGCDPANPSAPCTAKLYGGQFMPACQY